MVLAATFMLSGCGDVAATLPAGCYALENGKPLMKVDSHKIELLVAGDVKTVAIGPWRNKATGRFEVSPGFYLHDGTATAPAGPSVMSQVSPDSRTGELTYLQQEGEAVILVPIEAYGEKRAVRSSGC